MKKLAKLGLNFTETPTLEILFPGDPNSFDLLEYDGLEQILGGYKTCVSNYDPEGCPENYRCGENYLACEKEFLSCKNGFTGR